MRYAIARRRTTLRHHEHSNAPRHRERISIPCSPCPSERIGDTDELFPGDIVTDNVIEFVPNT